ncbi:MAG: hypothetical protein HKN47_24645 [Pirellulaceae bacterium]|nr:hypothetical protein [Pirellulaceae bacterium]
MIAIGRELRQRGFEVVISLSEPYAAIAQHAGLTVEPVISTDQFHEMVGDPAVWKTVRGVRRVLQAMSDHFVRPHHEVIRRHLRPGKTILVSHPLDYASRVIRESELATPLVDIHLQPVVLRTPQSPPKMTPWWFEISRPAWAVRLLYYLADHLGLDPVIRPAVNQLRSEYSLPPIRRVLNEWWLSPDRVIAMYPKWYAPETEIFCPRLVHAGFPLDDLDDRPLEPPPERPVVFTAGTAHFHGRRFFQRAVASCQELGLPGLLLSPHADNFPSQLPANVHTSSYVSLSKLLPHCQAIVHHGGIGTTSQSLAAATPQVIRPLAFDQFDNATRIHRLGCGVWLKRDAQLASTLQRLIGDRSTAQHCRDVAEQMSGMNGAQTAADEIASVYDRSLRHDGPKV